MSILICVCGHDDGQHDWTFRGRPRVPCRRCDCDDFTDEWEVADAATRHPANPTPELPSGPRPQPAPPPPHHHSWRLAEDMAQLSELGESQRQIGEVLGLHYSTVSLYLRVWSEYAVDARQQSLEFGECLKEIRGGWGHAPTSPAKKAEAAATYLRDRDVWKDDTVQEVMRAQVRKDVREESRPSLPKDDGGTKLTVITGTYWQITLTKLADTTRILRDAVAELWMLWPTIAERNEFLALVQGKPWTPGR